MAGKAEFAEIEAQAALYALGALAPQDARLFEQRLAAGCPLCVAEFRECERVVAALPLSVSESEPQPDLRVRLLQRIGAEAPGVRVSTAEGAIVRSGDTAWRLTEIPGVQVRPLVGDKTMLVRMAPKTRYPAHDHPSAEQCLVLEGALSTQGETVHAGDFTYMPAGSVHESLYSDEGCLLLVAYT